jgi:hypothetical protein
MGIGGGLLVARLMRAMLFGVGDADVVTFAAASLTLLVVSSVACYVPARRAASIDPLVCLRE